MSLSLYGTKELGSGSRPSHSAAQYADHSFIAFLALAQRLEIPFLPITWQALLDDLGEGGQARVSQASANAQTSFAFKRFGDDSTGNVDEDTPLQAVVNEMIMLSHHAIRDHPYVVTLEGICWDIPGDGDQVWPVLVFEKSIYGDLFEFVKSGHGSSLSIQEKLKLCTDIGISIRDMHSNNIKPQNVLIFKDEDHGFVAKMADFGFSIGFQGENDKIFLPESRPWNAPEYHERHFSPEEAKRVDIYSFGLLCFWLLFGMSGQLPLAPWMQNEDAESISFEGNRERLAILEWLKNNKDDDLLRWIAWIISRQDGFKDDVRYHLEQFFRFTLVRKPDQRNMNYNNLLSSLAPHRATQLLGEQIKTDFLLAEENFEIRLSFLEFYQADFRLRDYITASLRSISEEFQKELTQHILPQKAVFQLALCYRIGFGVPRDDIKAVELLKNSFRSWEDLEDEVSILKSATYRRPRQPGIYLKMHAQGSVPFIDLPQYYRERNIMEQAKHTYSREIRDHEEFGDAHDLNLTVKDSLAMVYASQGQWAKVEELQIQLKEINQRVLGLEHPDTLIHISRLISAYWNRGQWTKAEELQVQVVEIRKRILGLQHLDTLTSKSNLASIYFSQGRLSKAKELQVEVLETRRKILGPEHPYTLASISNLASTYWNEGQYTEAEKLQIQVTETSKRVLGPEHPSALRSTLNLASTYLEQKQWTKAEELQIQVLEIRKRVFGPEHPSTLNSISNLALTYWNQGRLAEAEELQVQVSGINERVLGLEHRSTLISLSNLALTYWKQGQLAKAKELQVQVTETSKKALTLEHPDTLSNILDLAVMYKEEGQLAKANELEAQVLEIKKRVSR